MTNPNPQKVSMKKVLRGFTLMEMVIVLGLILIVLAIATPAVTNYITRSRLNTMNADARVIFTSAQSICQEFEFLDRNSISSEFYGGSGLDANGNPLQSNKKGTVFIRYNKNDFNVSTNTLIAETANHTVIKAQATGASSERKGAYDILGGRLGISGVAADSVKEGKLTSNPDASNSSFLGRMNRLFPDMGEVCFALCIEDYTVKCVVCASDMDSVYVGAYPNKATEKASSGSSGEYMPIAYYSSYALLSSAF